MSNIVENVKKIGSEIEEGIEKGLEKAGEVLDNVASHLPFSNLAKKSNGAFRIEIDMPGVKKKDINIDVEGNLLTVSATREMKNEVKKKDYYLCESAFGKIERKFSIPDGVDRDKITAELEHGQLVIELEPEEKLKPKSIAIK
ncbi:MAG: Hsp20/alpha crystallin family protein [Epsilonproteobacteria bacterium]|nr:Hsp20/alpha crystallin family protein [Campylobacterota bacterium]